VYCDATRVAFGSELKALLPLLPTPPALDADAITEFLENEFLSGEGTVFAGIRHVPPGHALVIDHALNVQRERYWSLQQLRTLDLDMGQAHEAFSALFER
jgi:asparagine synthase (glutamine-hydrolysing)